MYIWDLIILTHEIQIMKEFSLVKDPSLDCHVNK